ncbi:MAG: FAD-binding oxidoreductase [Proteobacteria bacterium]|nr:FAD-binding oxidoreductase [Pseudomonadota bacterium]
MKQRLLTIETGTQLPDRVDVAMIGGGAAGVATAYELHRLGKRVAVFEKGRVAAEQSSRNWGWCRTLGRDLRELSMAKLGVDRWSAIGTEIGADVGFRRTGVTFVTKSPAELQGWEKWVAVAQQSGVKAEMVSRHDANSHYAQRGEPWIGGMRSVNDGYAEPSRAIPLLAAYASAQGVLILQQCAVNDLYFEAGRLAGVETERGLVRCDAVVIAGGAWSSLFCRKQKIALPVLNIYSSATKSHDVGPLGFDGPLKTPRFALRPRDDGGYTLAKSGRGTVHIVPDSLRYGARFLGLYRSRRGQVRMQLGATFFRRCWDEFGYLYLGRSPFTRCRTLDPNPDMALMRMAYDDAAHIFPTFDQDQLDYAWGGVIDNTPDGVPVVSAHGGIAGVYFCTGFSGHGFGSSLGAGRLLARHIVENREIEELKHVSYKRFLTGEQLAPNLIY